MNQDSREKILVVGPAWIGDMVMAQSLFMLLKQRFAGCEITVMAPAWTGPLLQRMPEVDASLELSFGHGELALGRRRAMGKSLRGRAFTRAIVLPNSFKSALIPYHARIPERTGWRGEMRNLLLNDCRSPDPKNYPLMVQRFAALAFPEAERPPPNIPSPSLSTDPRQVLASVRAFQLDPGQPMLALCPGAEYGPAKRWPAPHFAAVAGSYLERHWQVCLFGSENETPLADDLMAELAGRYRGHCRNLIGKTSLSEAIDLIAAADLVLSNDSGLMHIAAALQRPLAAIYGSTTADFTPPLTERVKLIWHDIDCRPCFKRECPYGHMRCLVDIKPDRVIRILEEL